MKRTIWYLVICMALFLTGTLGYYAMYRSQEFVVNDILGDAEEWKAMELDVQLSNDISDVMIHVKDGKISYEVNKDIEESYVFQKTYYASYGFLDSYPEYAKAIEPYGEKEIVHEEDGTTSYRRTIGGVNIIGYQLYYRDEKYVGMYDKKPYQVVLPVQLRAYSSENEQYMEENYEETNAYIYSRNIIDDGQAMGKPSYGYSGMLQYKAGNHEFYYVPQRQLDFDGINGIFRIYVKQDALAYEKVADLPEHQEEKDIKLVDDHLYLIVEKQDGTYLQKYDMNGWMKGELRLPDADRLDSDAWSYSNDHYLNVVTQKECYVIDLNQMQTIEVEHIDVEGKYVIDVFYRDGKLYSVYKEFVDTHEDGQGALLLRCQKNQKLLYEGKLILDKNNILDNSILPMNLDAKFVR